MGKRGWIAQSVVVVLVVAVLATRTNAQVGDITRVHDPTIIKTDSGYFLYSTATGLTIRHSDDLYTWERLGTVFDPFPDWAPKEVPGVGELWAPDISYFNGRYQLYYSVSTFGSMRSCIGLATNRTLDPKSADYKWIDHGKIIETKVGQKGEDYNAIDPTFAVDANGKPWLVFGSYWTGIKLCRLDPKTGQVSIEDKKLYSLAQRPKPAPPSVEAPVIIRKGKFYYLFVSFDACCQGAKSDYKTMVGRSEKITGPYVDMKGTKMMDGGGSLVIASQGSMRGPGHNAILVDGDREWMVHHWYDAEDKGRAKLHIRPMFWDEQGWPMVGEPISGPVNASSARAAKMRMEGKWNHSINWEDEHEYVFAPGGKIGNDDTGATWEMNGGKLVIRWHRPEAPGGVWVERCMVSPDGEWFVGRNQNGAIIRGRRVSGGGG